MTKKTKKTQANIVNISLTQGVDHEGRDYGFVAGENGNGGFFFTWMPTLEETVLSMEEDWTSPTYYTDETGDGGLGFAQVAEMLREHLPTTAKGKRMWGGNA